LKVEGIKLKAFCGVMAAVAWILFGATGVIRWIAGDGRLMGAEMLRTAPPEVTGLPEGDYAGVGVMTADFLTGRQENFQYVVAQSAGNGTACARTEVFQPHEAAHMEDCRKLIRLDTVVCVGSGLAALLFTGAGCFSRKGRRGFFRGLLWGLRGTAAAAGVLLVWALADFEGLFVTFHLVAFPQGGWLLDTRTDLLIRLMPTEFFVRLGLRGLLRFAAVPVILAACGHLGRRKTTVQAGDAQ
jgi:integral membrane protein (TIGR01906 family)